MHQLFCNKIVFYLIKCIVCYCVPNKKRCSKYGNWMLKEIISYLFGLDRLNNDYSLNFVFNR